MRTGIYVYKPTTVVIEATEVGLKLAQMGGKPDLKILGKSTEVMLQPGVYGVMSTSAIKVTGTDFEVSILVGKDPWPDPPPKATTELRITKASMVGFLASKEIDDL
jgi:hypothetical protein